MRATINQKLVETGERDRWADFEKRKSKIKLLKIWNFEIQNLCNQFYKLLPKFSLVPLTVISSHIISWINLCQSFSIRLVFFSKIWRSDFLFILSYDIDEYDIVFLKWQVFWYFYTSLSMLFYFYHRLKDLLRTRLIECGWRDQLKQHCKGKMYYLLTEHCKG